MPDPEPAEAEVDEDERDRLRQEGAARRLEEGNQEPDEAEVVVGEGGGGQTDPPPAVVGPILVTGDVPLTAYVLLLVGLLMGALAALARPRASSRRRPASNTPLVALAGTSALVVLAGIILLVG